MPFVYKPRHVVLDEGSLLVHIVALSLPEPSYVGSMQKVSAYWVSGYIFRFVLSATCTTSDPCATISSNKAKYFCLFILLSSHFSFISKNLTAVIMSIMAVILAFDLLIYLCIYSFFLLSLGNAGILQFKIVFSHVFILLLTLVIALLLVSRLCSLTPGSFPQLIERKRSVYCLI